MSSFRIRPVFTQIVDLGLVEAQQRIVAAVGTERGQFEVKNFPGFICLRIHAEDRHLWSPRLNLSMEQTPDGRTLINGTYGPNANVWSMYLYAYLITGLLGVLSGIFGICQWLIGEYAWGLWVFGGIVVLGLALYIAAQFGQKLGARQMYQIHLAYEDAIGNIAVIR